jgi:glycosyltransferase involved in cell wall biosynthesis
MNSNQNPLVSVLTPVYNGEPFLRECIESVLTQTYKNFEYIIVNNCSTDGSLEIARSYEKKDSRVRVHNNGQFVDVISNHNIAFRLISPEAKYCKIVSADDFVFPDCILRMVELAEANPSVGIVGSYQLSGSSIKWQGFRYPQAVFPGREVGRRIFIGGDKTFGHGSPTSLLYRADIVRGEDAFYPNPSPHSDTSACFKSLIHTDYGFVYQVLSYERIHGETQSSRSAVLDRYSSANLNDLIQYGPSYLDKDEFEQKLNAGLGAYYRFLAIERLKGRDKEFWDYHTSRLKELGFPIRFGVLSGAIAAKIHQEITHPGRIIRRIIGRSDD